MRVAARGELVREWHEVGGVLAQQRSPADAEGEQLLIGKAAELALGLGCDHVVAMPAQRFGDPGRIVLVEAERPGDAVPSGP